MFPVAVETDRLRLERAAPDAVDVRELYRVASGDDGIDEVTRYVSWDPHETPKETRDFLRACESGWNDAESAQYVVRPRDGEDGAGEIAGTTGLTLRWDRRLAEPGIWLRRRFWGRGYSGERAGALLALAFGPLDLEVVAVHHHPDNDESRRAVERYVDRFGGRREGRLRNARRFGDAPVDLVRYTVSRTEWREATADGGPDARFVWE